MTVAPLYPSAVQTSSPLDTWLAGQLTDSTRRAYLADLRQFLGGEPTLERCRQITHNDVIAYRNALAKAEYARTSINRKLSAIRSFFRLMVASGLLERNPAAPELVRGYKQETTTGGKSIATDHVQAILTAAEGTPGLAGARDRAILHTLLYGGLRREECARMQWEDIREEGVFHVLALPDTKSGTKQEIKLQPVVLHYLSAYRVELGNPSSGPVWLSLSRNSSKGRPLSGQAINLLVQAYARKAGIPKHLTAHMFRHTCCTLAIEGGAKPQQVQSHLRHKDLKTTMRYYEQRDKMLDNASDYIRLTKKES